MENSSDSIRTTIQGSIGGAIAASDTLQVTAPEAAAYRQQIAHWRSYFHEPVGNGGLKPDLITDPAELHQLTAFITWAAWASVADRPGSTYWHARSLAYTGTDAARLIEWLRLPGDLVFIIIGAVPVAIAAIKDYIGVHATRYPALQR